ncbi:YbhB/YbcL family Raf kinase inhibitor-like protein [candidate division WOR-3 bacterium]|nr:YbhB/YbcL family Raf kinase inhibitor-like protein [candidate division WOR-3 bacterium]
MTVGLSVLLAGCGGSAGRPEAAQPVVPAGGPAADSAGGRFALQTPAFASGGSIPNEYTGYGRDDSPEFNWGDPPAGTKSFALVCEDRDAPGGGFTHWTAFNIPADRRRLDRDASRQDAGLVQGLNDFGTAGYRGPMPPPGRAHRYFFRLYALDYGLELDAGAASAEVRQAIAGHVLGEAGLMGTFRR